MGILSERDTHTEHKCWTMTRAYAWRCAQIKVTNWFRRIQLQIYIPTCASWWYTTLDGGEICIYRFEHRIHGSDQMVLGLVECIGRDDSVNVAAHRMMCVWSVSVHYPGWPFKMCSNLDLTTICSLSPMLCTYLHASNCLFRVYDIED